MTLQSRGKIVSFIRFRKTQKILSRNSWRRSGSVSGAGGEGKRVGGSGARASHLQLLLAVEVVEQMVEVDLSHLLEQREQAGDVLALPGGSDRRGGSCLEGDDPGRSGGKNKPVRWSRTYRDLSGALGAALASGRLHRVRLAHDGQQRLQQHVQEALYHHLHLLLDRGLLKVAAEKGRDNLTPSSSFMKSVDVVYIFLYGYMVQAAVPWSWS